MNLDGPLATLREYQSRVKLGGNHRYTADGKWMPGTTTIIKTLAAPALVRWMVTSQAEGTAKAAYRHPPGENESVEDYVIRMRALAERQLEHEKRSDEAARIGTDVHRLIEAEVRRMMGETVQEPADVMEEALYRFAGWRRWAKDVQLTPLAVEARVFNPQHGYCGTLDLLCTIEGRPVLKDWKPNSSLWCERRLQSASYRKALVAMGWPEMDGGIVSIPRDGGDIEMIYAEPPGPELDAAFDSFLALLKVYRWQSEVGKRERKAKKVEAA